MLQAVHAETSTGHVHFMLCLFILHLITHKETNMLDSEKAWERDGKVEKGPCRMLCQDSGMSAVRQHAEFALKIPRSTTGPLR